MPNYSFLMSVYFREKAEYLKQSIDSMVAQTIFPEEIVIVKDGPLTDELNSVIDSFVKEYGQLFTIIELRKNVGLGNALNIGLKKARNELVARMDSDDISFADRCEKILNCFAKNPDLVVVGGQIYKFMGSTNHIIASRTVPTDYKEIIKFAKRKSPFNHPTVFLKKSIILKEGGYPSSGRKEDLDLFLHILSKGYQVSNIKEVVLYYRANEDNYKRRKKWSNCKEYIAIINKYRKYGFCSFFDLVYVVLGQVFLFFSPVWLLKKIDKKSISKI